MASIAELRQKARAHSRELESVLWETVQTLAVRWGVDEDQVREIPRERLPYLEFGKRRVRRYDPADVLAYEEREKAGFGEDV